MVQQNIEVSRQLGLLARQVTSETFSRDRLNLYVQEKGAQNSGVKGWGCGKGCGHSKVSGMAYSVLALREL